ncbi:MAG: extracellular solute-binding protein [Oscillospiraceae bacterium]
MKNITKALSLILVVALLCGTMAACGGKDAGESPNPSADAGGKVWMATFKQPTVKEGSLNQSCISGDSVYAVYSGGTSYSSSSFSGLTGSTTVSTSSISTDADYTPVIYKISRDGASSEKLEAYAPAAMPEGIIGNTNINAICADAEGNLWVMEEAYSYHYDLPEGFSGSEADKQQYFKDDGSKYFLRKLDASGKELVSIDLAALAAGAEYFHTMGLECDAAGNVYFSDGNTKIYVYDKDGAAAFNIDLKSYVNGIYRLSDGAVAAMVYEEQGIAVKPIDAKTKAFGTSIPLDYPDAVYSGSGDSYFMYTKGDGLFGYDKATGSATKILSWLDCDILSGDIRALATNDDGSLLAVMGSGQGSGSAATELALISQRDASELANKTVLTLAVMNTDYVLSKQIQKFNRSSEKYRIQVRDYSEFNTKDNYDIGRQKLNTEIIAGNVPDIISVAELPLQQYAAKGLLTDLYQFIDSDKELSRDSFMPSVLKSLEIDGALYQAASGFAIFTLVGKTDMVGEDMGWTLEEMMELYNKQPKGTELMQQGATQQDILKYLSVMNMQKFVNWESGECSFDSDEFKNILNFCKLFDATFEYDQAKYESEGSRIRSGKQMLSLMTAYNFTDFQMYEAMFEGDVTFKGFPVESGSGSMAMAGSGLAISSTCKDKEGAWSFVRTLLSEEYQSGGDVWNFPTNKAAFDSKLAEAMKVEYTTDENGNQVEVSKGGMGWDDMMIELYAVKQEQADKIMALINAVDGGFSFDESITTIIQDEATGFFAGDKSETDTAKNIQSRISLYVNEQK